MGIELFSTVTHEVCFPCQVITVQILIFFEGAWAARYLALLINLIGLPKDGDEGLFYSLYKACDNGSIFVESVLQDLLLGYKCKLPFLIKIRDLTRSDYSKAGKTLKSMPYAVLILLDL